MFELEQEAFGLRFPGRKAWEGCSAPVKERMIGQCISDVDQQWEDPGAYCYHHFYPYKPED